jgi:hypothetical protein
MIDYIDIKNVLLISNISLVQSNNDNIININIFKRLYKYYMDYYSNYYYISKNKPFIKLKECITNHIIKIFKTNDINYIKNIIIIYQKEFIALMKHIDINYVLLSYTPSDTYTYISYYNTLYEIFKNDFLNKIIIECIKENVNTYFNTFENIMYLADLINVDIINKKLNDFYYILGSYIKNKY